MSTDKYVPTTDQIRAFWASDGNHVPAAKSYGYVESYAEFDRWLAAHDARVHRDAAREALDGLIHEAMGAANSPHSPPIPISWAEVAGTVAWFRNNRYPSTEETP